MVYDIIIIGSGPAGMTAAIYAARADKKVMIIDKEGFGGNITKSPLVENIPGFMQVSGMDFAENMYNQMQQFSNIEYSYDEVIDIKRYEDNNTIYVTLSDNSVIEGKTAVIATGTKHREIDLPTKNIYYCVTCDGPFFKGKNVLVAGSGNTGATYALELAKYCNKVYLIDITPEMKCEKILKDRIAFRNELDKIRWVAQCKIVETVNDEQNNLKQVCIDYAVSDIERNQEYVDVDAIFVAIGMNPNTSFVKNIDLNNQGYIISDETCKTNIENIFVAGDVRTKTIRQVTTACADGTTAALHALNYLDNLENR